MAAIHSTTKTNACGITDANLDTKTIATWDAGCPKARSVGTTTERGTGMDHLHPFAGQAIMNPTS